MIKLFKKLVNWCLEPTIYKSDVIENNKFYIPASQVFCFTKKEKKKLVIK